MPLAARIPIRALDRSLSVFLLLCMTATSAFSWPGPYSGSRILGGGGVCAVLTELPERCRADEYGIHHFYIGDYTVDYLSACHPTFGIGGAWEDGRGANGQARPAGGLTLAPGGIESTSTFRSLLDPELLLSTCVFSTPGGQIVFEVSVRNTGSSVKEVLVRPRVAFRLSPRSIESWTDASGMAIARFDAARIEAGFVGDRQVSSVRSHTGDFPGIEQVVTVTPGSIARTAFALAGLPISSARTFEEAPSLASTRARWESWLRTNRIPAVAATDLNRVLTATLTATAATSLHGAVPADMTGQFVTEGRPQLYPRDALMTARALLEAGQVEMAAEIVRFWNASIPQKSPGEWYARYDAFARATPGGSGAAYDEPEWDSNGYYATLLLLLFERTGFLHGDHALMKSLLDFVLSKQDEDGLLTEGGIVEWTGLLPATNMNVAAGLRHGALLCAIRGETAVAARYRAAAARMEAGLDRLFSRERGAYMDTRAGRESFNTSANFGYVWGYPDHTELALTNAWYRDHAFQLGAGVQYFEAEGYGDDCFGFTTGAAARYHFEVGEREVARANVRWMMERSNAYGMMPERVHFPGGNDVSEASPLSWCNAEFAAAVLAGARVADPAIGAGADFAIGTLAEDLEGFARIARALSGASNLAAPLARLDAQTAAEIRDAVSRLGSIGSIIDAFMAGIDATPPGGVNDDLRPLLLELRRRADRIALNMSGAGLEVRVDRRLALHDRTTVAVAASGDGVAWESLVIEGRDGNDSPVARSLPFRSGRLAADWSFHRGEPPYATAVAVTASGRWQGLPIRVRRVLPIDVLPGHEMTVVEAGDGYQATVTRNADAAPRSLRVLAPRGWTVRPAGSSGRVRRFHVRPARRTAPGIYPVTLVVTGGRTERFETRVAWKTEVSLEGSWAFRTGDDPSWSAAALDVGAWDTLPVPAAWEKAGRPGYDGYAWYRTQVRVPDEWRGRDLFVVLGAIDDEDWTYWNGREIGHVSVWNELRRYRVPAEEVRFDAPNSIAVRVRDGMYDGGIWKSPVRIELALP